MPGIFILPKKMYETMKLRHLFLGFSNYPPVTRCFQSCSKNCSFRSTVPRRLMLLIGYITASSTIWNTNKNHWLQKRQRKDTVFERHHFLRCHIKLSESNYRFLGIKKNHVADFWRKLCLLFSELPIVIFEQLQGGTIWNHPLFSSNTSFFWGGAR